MKIFTKIWNKKTRNLYPGFLSTKLISLLLIKRYANAFTN